MLGHYSRLFSYSLDIFFWNATYDYFVSKFISVFCNMQQYVFDIQEEEKVFSKYSYRATGVADQKVAGHGVLNLPFSSTTSNNSTLSQ